MIILRNIIFTAMGLFSLSIFAQDGEALYRSLKEKADLPRDYFVVHLAEYDDAAADLPQDYGHGSDGRMKPGVLDSKGRYRVDLLEQFREVVRREYLNEMSLWCMDSQGVILADHEVFRTAHLEAVEKALESMRTQKPHLLHLFLKKVREQAHKFAFNVSGKTPDKTKMVKMLPELIHKHILDALPKADESGVIIKSIASELYNIRTEQQKITKLVDLVQAVLRTTESIKSTALFRAALLSDYPDKTALTTIASYIKTQAAEHPLSIFTIDHSGKQVFEGYHEVLTAPDGPLTAKSSWFRKVSVMIKRFAQ